MTEEELRAAAEEAMQYSPEDRKLFFQMGSAETPLTAEEGEQVRAYLEVQQPRGSSAGTGEKKHNVSSSLYKGLNLGSWVEDFLAAHEGENRKPNDYDVADLLFSQQHPGSEPGGGWNDRDWLMNYAAKTRTPLPEDWSREARSNPYREPWKAMGYDWKGPLEGLNFPATSPASAARPTMPSMPAGGVPNLPERGGQLTGNIADTAGTLAGALPSPEFGGQMMGPVPIDMAGILDAYYQLYLQSGAIEPFKQWLMQILEEEGAGLGGL